MSVLNTSSAGGQSNTHHVDMRKVNPIKYIIGSIESFRMLRVRVFM